MRQRRRFRGEWFAIGIVTLACAGCSTRAAGPAIELPAAPQPLDQPHLPNAYRLHSRVISGGQPAGEAGFRALAKLGVQTVISVDGARPQVDLASRFGLRYVHLPHGYDRILPQRASELAKAVRELPGPIYIHCHHGRHRSPAAAAVACIGAGLLPREAGRTVLQVAGTSPHYRGLYQSTQAAQRIEDRALEALDVEFPARAQVTPLAETMVAVDAAHRHLQASARAGWSAPPAHPDVDPAHEALQLREHFAELLRDDKLKSRPPRFRELIRESQVAAAELEAALRARRRAEDLAGSLRLVSDRCDRCHHRYRDAPQ